MLFIASLYVCTWYICATQSYLRAIPEAKCMRKGGSPIGGNWGWKALPRPTTYTILNRNLVVLYNIVTCCYEPIANVLSI
jgi:hypothetical protein